MRIASERCAVGMIGGQKNSPRIVDAQKYFQAYRPLQRIDEIFVAIMKRHHAATRIAFDVHHNKFFGIRKARVTILRHAVTRCGDRLAEHDLTHIATDVFVRVDRFGNTRSAGRKFSIAFGAIGMELNMSQMNRQAVRRSDGRERRLDIARHTEIAGVYM